MLTRIVILAAGRSTRMNSGVPKVLTPFKGKPLIKHLLQNVEVSGIDPRPVVVVGYQADLVRNALGDRYVYVFQSEQLGTGHAVRCAEKIISPETDAIIVLYGDHPLVSASTIRRLKLLHEEEGGVLTMLTAKVEDFNEWRAPLVDFGRIVRDGRGSIRAIIEAKDATPEELTVREVNPAFFCFNALWLWRSLSQLNNKNVKGEYYLTDLVRLAIEGGERVVSLGISPLESIGVNTPEQLELASSLNVH